jgi:V/A-type H+-transporting ATPase subunit A
LTKQALMLSAILRYYDEAKKALEEGAELGDLLKLSVLEDIARAKLIPEDSMNEFDALTKRIGDAVNAQPKY